VSNASCRRLSVSVRAQGLFAADFHFFVDLGPSSSCISVVPVSGSAAHCSVVSDSAMLRRSDSVLRPISTFATQGPDLICCHRRIDSAAHQSRSA
jgi:hypothetical protein